MLTRQAPAPFGCERWPAQDTGRNLHVSTAVEPPIAVADMASDQRWIEAALR